MKKILLFLTVTCLSVSFASDSVQQTKLQQSISLFHDATLIALDNAESKTRGFSLTSIEVGPYIGASVGVADIVTVGGSIGFTLVFTKDE